MGDSGGFERDDADGSEELTEFAVGLDAVRSGQTGLRRMPKSHDLQAALEAGRARASAAAAEPTPPASGLVRRPPSSRPGGPGPAERDDDGRRTRRPAPGREIQAAGDLSSIVEEGAPAELDAMGSAAPLDPAAFESSAAEQVESLIDQVIDEVDALSPKGQPEGRSEGPKTDRAEDDALAADLVLDAPGGAGRPLDERSPLPPSPKRSSFPTFPTARDSRTEVVDSEAAAIDLAVSRSVETGVRRPRGASASGERPQAGAPGDDEQVKVVVGRPEQSPSRSASGLELAYEPSSRPTAPRRQRRSTGTAGDVLDQVTPEGALVPKLLAIAVIVIMALVAFSALRSCGT